MSQALAPVAAAPSIERVLIEGDLSRLSAEQKVAYYMKVCESLGLNPYTKPFDYLKLNGREILYARKDATDQLRKAQHVSIVDLQRERLDDLYVVTATARTPDGRSDSSIGAVMVKGLAGEGLANALMKAETKAKRRVTLSICGLGMTDDSEVESIPGAERVDFEVYGTPSVPYTPPKARDVEDAPRQPQPKSREELREQYLALLDKAIDIGVELDDDEWTISEDVAIEVLRDKGPKLQALVKGHRAQSAEPIEAQAF